jgi:hypothetical protein
MVNGNATNRTCKESDRLEKISSRRVLAITSCLYNSRYVVRYRRALSCVLFCDLQYYAEVTYMSLL